MKVFCFTQKKSAGWGFLNHPRHARGNPEKPSPSPLERRYDSTRVTTGCFVAFNESRRTCFTLTASARGRRNPGDCLSSSRQTGYVEAPHKKTHRHHRHYGYHCVHDTVFEPNVNSNPHPFSAARQARQTGWDVHNTLPRIQAHRSNSTDSLALLFWRRGCANTTLTTLTTLHGQAWSRTKNQNAAHASIRSPHLPSPNSCPSY